MKNTTLKILVLTAGLCAGQARAAYGDLDLDGLDAWQEARAGTSPTNAHTFDAARLDYDWAVSNGVKTAGEAWDDFDLMPAQWETAHGLDPGRFDAYADADDDGWTNYEEWIAGTAPGDPRSVPRPHMDIVCIYDGAATNAASPLRVQTYSERSNVRIDGTNALHSPHVGPVPDAEYRAMAISSARASELSVWSPVGPDDAKEMHGGYNRLLGFFDINGNGNFDPRGFDRKPYEPMGLSLYNAVLAGPDSFKATIPLTDELFGFPRISWPASTNANVTRYEVIIKDSENVVVSGSNHVYVEAPRTFVHEGDYLEAGLRGFDFRGKTGDVFSWEVMGRTDHAFSDSLVASGTFVASLVPNSGSRRPMKAVSPVAESTVYGSLVEFKWEMDWRTEGVFFTVKDSSGTPVAGLNNLYVPLPVRHNKITDDDYYYSYIPQLENGRSIVSLPSGTYTYTIKPNIRSTASTFTAEKNGISGSFTIDNEENDSRLRASIKGHVHYYGRLPEADVPGKVVVQAYKVSNRARTSLSVGGSPVAKTTANADGSFELTGLEAGTYGVVGWVDDDGDGVADATETQGFGFLGNSASPVLPSNWCPPLAITNDANYAAVDLEDVHVVLRDRDPNADGIPDGTGFPSGGTLASRMASYLAMPLRTFPDVVPAGFDWMTPSIFSTNNIGGLR